MRSASKPITISRFSGDVRARHSCTLDSRVARLGEGEGEGDGEGEGEGEGGGEDEVVMRVMGER